MVQNRSRLNLITLLCLLFISQFSLSPGWTVSAHGAPCGDGLAPRLTIGGMGRVTPGNSNNVRDEAKKTGKLLGQIAGGEVFNVLDGPICADGLNWWQVRYGELQGWTVEAAGKDYWLEPYDPSKPEKLTPTDDFTYEYEGIRFKLDPALAASVTAFHLAPVVDDPNYDPPSPIAPEGVEFSFANSNGKTIKLSLRVYSVEDYKKAYEFAERDINKLSQMLADNPGWLSPDGKEKIPVLSIVEPPMLMRARANELGFTNGSGYRFLAEYSYDVREILNPLEYLFSGVTYDQQYYVMARAQVTTPLLADKMTQFGAEFEDHFETYRSDIIKSLVKAKPEEFGPNLDLLDGLMQSLQVHGPQFKVTVDNDITHIQYDNISFDVASSYAKAATFQIDQASWETMSPLPEHVCLGLHSDESHIVNTRTNICFIPTERMDEYVKKIRQLVKDKPTFEVPDGRTRIPIPFNGAAQLMHSQVNYIETDALQGVRFVTRYAQMDYYIGGNTLEYNFSGVTRGGKYIIFLQFGVSTKLLSDKVPSTAQLSNLLKDPPKYYKQVVDTLNSGTSADFNPNLEIFDAIVQSIRFS